MTYFSPSSDFDINLCSIVHFSLAVIAASFKPCIEIDLSILFEHTLWPSNLDLLFTLHWLWHKSMWNIAFFCSNDSCEFQTLHRNCLRHTVQASTVTLWPWPILYSIDFVINQTAMCNTDLCRMFYLISHSKHVDWTQKNSHNEGFF